MANQDSQAQPGGTVATNGRPAVSGRAVTNGSAARNGKAAKRDTDDIVAEIELTRQSLARTIDSLADRVSPAGNARRLRARAAEQASRPQVQLAGLAVALAVTGITIYRIWGRRRA